MEFDVSGQRYSSGKISVFEQFFVIKRLTPLIGALGPSLSADALRAAQKQAAEAQAVSEGQEPSPDVSAKTADLMKDILPALIDGIQAVSDSDTTYIFTTCLKVVRRRSGDRWQDVWNAGADRFQFQDISLPDMLMIVFNVLTDNLSSFLAGLPEPTEASPPAAPSSSL